MSESKVGGLAELLAKWREPENPPLNQDQLRQAIRNGARMDCADELEAALATEGDAKAVAWPNPIDAKTMQVTRIIQRGLDKWPRAGAISMAHEITAALSGDTK